MADPNRSVLPLLTPEHRQIAAAQCERADQAITTGNYDYGIRLLLSCCKLDPGNLIYRQALRRAEKTKYKNNLRGSKLAGVSTITIKAKLKSAKRSRDFLSVLEHGEQVLTYNPWDVGAQTDMAEAADELGLLDLAIWLLEQARQKDARATSLNRMLARLYERRGNFTQAIALWELVRRSDPSDVEAQHKAKDLAANETIARGHYQEAVDGNEKATVAPEQEADEAGDAQPAPGRVSDARLARETAPLLARIKSDPTNVHAYLSLAAVYRRANHFDEGREVLEQGLAATGQSYLLSLELLDLEIEPFRRNLAVADEKLKTEPENEELRKIRIRLLKEINTRELDLYRQRADRFPTEMTHRFELGVRLLRAGQLDEAIRELQATRADPRNQWRSLLYLGYCFKSRNNWRLAQRNFEEALQTMPAGEEAARKEILFQLAQGAADAGDLAKAIDLGHDLANLDFVYRDIGRLLDEWQDRLEQAKVSG